MQLAPESQAPQKPVSRIAKPRPEPVATQSPVDNSQAIQSEINETSPDSHSKSGAPLFHRIDMPPLQGSAGAQTDVDESAPAAPPSQNNTDDLLPPQTDPQSWSGVSQDWQEPHPAQQWMNSSRRRYRRNMTHYYSMAAVVAGLLLVGANVLLWKSDFTQGVVDPAMLSAQSSPLQLKITEVPRAAFQPNGDIEQPVTVRIDNPTESVQPIPRIRARMIDGNNQLVFAWTFQARQTHLPAGKSLSVRTRATNFPTDPLPVRLSLEFVDKAKS